MDEPTAPYFETATFHQNPIDHAAWVYYTVENAPPGPGGPHLVTYAAGSARWQLVERATGIAKPGSVIAPFYIAGAPYNMAAYPPVDTSVAVQIKPPFAPPMTAPPGFIYHRVGVYYDYAIIGDLVSHAAAVATYDPGYPPQPPL